MHIDKKYTLNKYKTLVWLFCIFNFTTIIQRTIENIQINRMIGALIAINLILIYIKNINTNKIFTIFIIFSTMVTSAFVTTNYSIMLNDFLYLIVTLLVIEILKNDDNLKLFYSALLRSKHVIFFTVVIINSILLILLITKIGYRSGWGGEYYFVGLSNTAHTLASACCLTFALVVLYNKLFNKSYILSIMSLITMWALFQSGARTFLLPAGIYCVFIINTLFKRRKLRFFIYGVAAILFTTVLLKSNMLEKFTFSGNADAADFWGGITSGRSVFWIVDLNAFKSFSIYEMIFGKSFSSVYSINYEHTRMFIWAHNDFIHILLGTGIIGLSLYVSKLINLFRYWSHFIGNKLELALCILYIIVPASINGYFPYQHYVYSTMFFYMIFYKSNIKQIHI